MAKLIKNNEFIRAKMDKCIEMLQTSSWQDMSGQNNTDMLLEENYNSEYLSLELIKILKNCWNENDKEQKLFIHELLASTELYLPKLKSMTRVILV